MTNKIIKTIAGGALLTAFLAVPLLAQPTNDAAKARVAAMKEMGGAGQVMRTQAAAEAPDMAAVKTAAATYTSNAAKLYNLFPAGSGAPAGTPGAKPEIWTMPVEFKAAQDNFAKAAKALADAAAAGDVAAVKAANMGIGQACGGCHRTFRAQAPRPAPAAAPAPAPAG